MYGSDECKRKQKFCKLIIIIKIILVLFKSFKSSLCKKCNKYKNQELNEGFDL